MRLLADRYASPRFNLDRLLRSPQPVNGFCQQVQRHSQRPAKRTGTTELRRPFVLLPLGVSTVTLNRSTLSLSSVTQRSDPLHHGPAMPRLPQLNSYRGSAGSHFGSHTSSRKMTATQSHIASRASQGPRLEADRGSETSSGEASILPANPRFASVRLGEDNEGRSNVSPKKIRFRPRFRAQSDSSSRPSSLKNSLTIRRWTRSLAM